MAGLHCMCLNPINKCESPLIVHYLYTQYMCGIRVNRSIV